MLTNSANSPSGSTSKCFISSSRSVFSISVWDLTETYSPTAIDIAPATIPARPAVIINSLLLAAAIPIIKLAVETKPSFEPSTAARSQFERFERCSIFRI